MADATQQTGRQRRIAKALWAGAQARAKKDGLPFDLTVDDIVVPHYCPALGYELIPGEGTSTDYSPTLDRIVPTKGYVRGNVVVVSMRANRIKNNASLRELTRLASFYQQMGADE